MYLLDEKFSVPNAAMERAIAGLIKGHFERGSSIDFRQERTRRAAYYETYARLCLSSAYPSGVPSDISNEQLTVELIERAADGVYSFRKSNEQRKSQIALECRWMLEGFLEFHVISSLDPWHWNQIKSSTAVEQMANLEILDAKLRRMKDDLFQNLGYGTGVSDTATAKILAPTSKRSIFGRKK